MNDEPNDVARWAAMQDAVNARGAENRVKLREAKPTGPLKADDNDLRGQAKRNSEAAEHHAALDAIQARRAEGVEDASLRGEMEFARCLGSAPSLVSAFQKLKDDGRA